MATQKLTGDSTPYYGPETKLAKAIFELDREALVTWFVAGDDDTFEARLEQSLRQYHSQGEAKRLALYVTSLTHLKKLLYEKAKEETSFEETDPDYQKDLEAMVRFWLGEIAELIRKR